MTGLTFLPTLALSTNKRSSVCERVARDALTLLTYLLWLADRLERIAGHCAAICERTVFIAEGSPITMLTLAS